MGLCLEAAGKLTVVEQNEGTVIEHTAECRKFHGTFAIGCLRLSDLTPNIVSSFLFGP